MISFSHGLNTLHVCWVKANEHAIIFHVPKQPFQTFPDFSS